MVYNSNNIKSRLLVSLIIKNKKYGTKKIINRAYYRNNCGCYCRHFCLEVFSGKTAVNDQASGEQNGQVINLSDYIFMVNQKPGRFVNVSKVILSKKGYVAIHQEEAGKAGAVIGYSNLLNSGESKNFSVTLNRKSVAGKVFMLWFIGIIAMEHLIQPKMFQPQTKREMLSRLSL